MEKACVATYRIAGLVVCSFLLNGCGGYGGGDSIPPPFLSSDAALSSLSVNPTMLTPVFSPSVLSYTATVANGVDNVAVAATPSNLTANITINGSTNTTVPLTVGDNPITIEVTVRDIYSTASRVYRVTVTRATMVIDTTANWKGTESAAPFGDGGAVEIFGQTFVVAAGAPTLQRLSFWLQHSPDDMSGEDLYFSIAVMAWSIDRATGPVLYESALQSITTAQSTMTEYLVDTGGLNLVPGQEYVAFLSAKNGFWDATSTLMRVGWQNADTYSDGAAWTLNTDNNPNLITSAAWDNTLGTADFVVRLAF
jgi:hypothetical protein